MLIFEEHIPNNKTEFIQGVKNISKELEIDPNALMAVMYKESSLNPAAQNPYIFSDGGKATGLIQFIPSTAIQLGTTVDELKNMSNVEQLYYILKYYEPYKELLKADTLLDQYYKLYLITFYPNAGKVKGGTLTKNDNWTFPSSVYVANKGLDTDKNGKLTIFDIKKSLYNQLPGDWKNKFGQSVKAKKTYKTFYIISGIILIIIIGSFIYIRVKSGK